jgi:mercuric ion transport protein
VKDVELIYDARCPNVEAARSQLRRAFEAAHLPAQWREWIRGAVGNPARIEKYGSPTILVDGNDVARANPAEGSTCRLYTDGEGRLRGVPLLQTIVLALVSGDKGNP